MKSLLVLKNFTIARWTELLPLILLRLRTTFKQDLQCTPAQLVYGTTLRLLGQFFISSPATMPLDPTLYADRLSSYMHQLRPVPPRLQSPPSHVPPNPSTCTHVFVRHDAIHKPLDPPYDGSYQIIRRYEKHFLLDIQGKQIFATLNRLKPGYLDSAPVNTTPDTLKDSPTWMPLNPRFCGVSLAQDEECIFQTDMGLLDFPISNSNIMFSLLHLIVVSYIFFYFSNVTFHVHSRGEPCSKYIFSYLSSTPFIHSLGVFLHLITITSSMLTLNQHHTNILLRHNTLPFC